MHRLFQKKLEQILISHIECHHSEYRQLKSNPKGVGKSIIFVFKKTPRFKGYIQIQFEPDRNFVFLFVRWSRLARFPSDDALVDASEIYTSTLDVFKSLDECVLPGNMFGRSNYVEMELDGPDEKFCLEKYSIDNSRRLQDYQAISAMDLTSEYFCQLSKVVGWDIVINCFGGNFLSESDVIRALGKMPSDIIDFIDSHAVPYISAVANMDVG